MVETAVVECSPAWASACDLGGGEGEAGVVDTDRGGEHHAVDGAVGGQQRPAGVARLDHGPDLVDLPGDRGGLVDVRALGVLDAADPGGHGVQALRVQRVARDHGVVAGVGLAGEVERAQVEPGHVQHGHVHLRVVEHHGGVQPLAGRGGDGLLLRHPGHHVRVGHDVVRRDDEARALDGTLAARRDPLDPDHAGPRRRGSPRCSPRSGRAAGMARMRSAPMPLNTWA